MLRCLAGAAVEIVERAASPNGGGAGLYLPGNATRALRRPDGHIVRIHTLSYHHTKEGDRHDTAPYHGQPATGAVSPARPSAPTHRQLLLGPRPVSVAMWLAKHPRAENAQVQLNPRFSCGTGVNRTDLSGQIEPELGSPH